MCEDKTEKRVKIELELSFHQLMAFCQDINNWISGDFDDAIFETFFDNALDLMESWEDVDAYLYDVPGGAEHRERFLLRALRVAEKFSQAMEVFDVADKELGVGEQVLRRAVELATTEDNLADVEEWVVQGSGLKQIIEQKRAELKAKPG